MKNQWQPRAAPGIEDGLVLFDGACVLCSRWAQFVISRDPTVRFRFLPIQTKAGRNLAEHLTIDPDHPQTNAVILNGIAYFKSDAAIALASRLPRWRRTKTLRFAPRFLRDRIYDLVAQNRYRLFGRQEICLTPTEGLKQHLVSQSTPIQTGSGV